MGNSLASFPEEKRLKVAERRVNGKTFGLGYWGARDYYAKKKLKLPGDAGKMQVLAAVMKGSHRDEKSFTTGHDTKNQTRPPRKKNTDAGKSRYQQDRRRKPGGVKLSTIWPKGALKPRPLSARPRNQKRPGAANQRRTR